MNSGYLSLILLCITLILFASGWKELYVRSISHKGMLLFFALWLVGSSFSITIKQVHIQLVYILVFLISVGILYVTQGFIHKLHLLSIGLLLGSLHFLLQQLLEMDPILIVRNSDWDIAILLAFIAVVLQRSALEQIAAISIGYLLGDMYQAGIHPVGGYHHIGHSTFQDQWWLSVFTARTMTIILQAVYNGCRSVIRSWMERKGGWRK
ncbi:YphA family membrane protein [Paenibacillus aceris]|uniref:Uncharacterized protein n=1 Tax=Paenibacillus aceris TaxID=869555 RepID=A0ABS4HTU2_9BACL|nr:hypothetical protein [Paenibacillus aceris]MBP1961988.1 hypothetical protein [Paenibacillus aceris]NHW34163.1 hypothetical protein [Paenibacillus aceris]